MDDISPSLESNVDNTDMRLKSNFSFHILSYRVKFGKYKLDFEYFLHF